VANANNTAHHTIPRKVHDRGSEAIGPSSCASGVLPTDDAPIAVVVTFSTKGTCAPAVRFAVAGCTAQVLSDAASVHVSATAPAKPCDEPIVN
jgi:hypothetical protein